MRKNTKTIIISLILLTAFIGFTLNRNIDKEFTAGLISSHWLNENNKNSYGITIDLESGFSRDEIEYLGSIATKDRKNELSVTKAKDLENPNHYMTVYISEKSTGITKEKLDFNLWTYKDKGYIQFIKDEDVNNTRLENLNGISKLENEEYQFLTKLLLKYHSPDDIFKNNFI